jgi:RNA polymerase sigma factor (sigma-70 family)
MDTQPLGETLHYLRRIAGTADDSRLDAELLERFVAAHDEAAFALLTERYGPLVLGVCRRVLRNHHDAEDAFQATFLVLARKAGQIRRRDALAAWLYKVAFQLSVKLRTSSERRRQAEGEMSLPREQTSDDRITWAELRLVLDEELRRLPEKYRAPLLLCCLAGRTRDEAASQLGWTLATLKMRLERGRQMLRTRLARRGLPVSATLLAMLLAQNAAANPVPAVLATTTFKAAVLFAAGTTSAALPAEVVRLAGLSSGAGKGKTLAAAALLLGLIGLAVGSLASLRPTEPPGPPAERAANVDTPLVVSNGFVDATEESGLGDLLRRHYTAFPDWQPSGATLLDLHGDGRLDLHLAGQSEDLAALGRNTGGRFAYADPRPEIRRGPRHWDDVPYPGGQIRHAFDLNEDGKLDLAVSWHNNGGALYYHSSARDGLRYRRAKFVEPEFLDIRASALADVDGDGVVDFLTSDNEGDLAVHLGIGDGTFSSAPNAVIPTGLRCAGAIPVDLDGDGQLELIVRQTAFELPARRKIFRRIAPLKWADVTRETGLTPEGSVHGVGDLNGDGYPDLICMEGQQIVLYLNDGKGRFTRKADAVRGLERASNWPHPEWGDRWGGAVVVDFDNDGVPDILINGKCFLYLLRGTGDGTFEYVNDRWGLPDFAYCDVDDGLCFGDVDGDGRLDLVLAASPPDDERRPVALYRNQLPPQHWLRVQLVGKPGNRSATGARIRLYEAGKPDHLLASEQVAVWGRQSFHSYYAARRTERHFGLGKCSAVDVSVEFYPSGRRVVRTNVAADGVVEIAETGG